jgi:hypothetical protein
MSTYGLTRPGERPGPGRNGPSDESNTAVAAGAPTSVAERSAGIDVTIALALNLVLTVLAVYCWSLGKPLVAGMIAGIPLASLLRIFFNKITGI